MVEKEIKEETNTEVKKETGKNTILQLKNVKKSFGKNAVLKGVDLSVKKGETICVLGKSGTGKSVILKCIIGLVKPDEGQIFAFGEDIVPKDEEGLEEIWYKMGFLFQGGALYDSMTVRENLEFPLERQPRFKDKDNREKIKDALDSVGLLSAIDKMPSELSGGMKKRIALARTIILEPEILLYDEPTTGLDPVTSKDISHLIVDMQEKYKVTSIVVTHDMPCAKIVSDRIVVLKEGKFFKEGTYEELEKSDDEFVRGFFEFE